MVNVNITIPVAPLRPGRHRLAVRLPSGHVLTVLDVEIGADGGVTFPQRDPSPHRTRTP